MSGEARGNEITWELRNNEDGTPDEVLLYVGGKCVAHLEQLDTGAWWMGLYGWDARDHAVHVNLHSKRAISCLVEEDGRRPFPKQRPA